MSNIDELVERVEALLNGNERVEIDMEDLAVADMVGEIKKAKARLAMTHKGLCVDFPSAGSNALVISRIGEKSVASEAAASKSPGSAITRN